MRGETSGRPVRGPEPAAWVDCETVASDPLEVRLGDLFNPPGLTNFLGTVQALPDVSGVRALTFAPLASGDDPTGQLFVDGRLVAASGAPVTFRWRPDRIERSCRLGELAVSSTTLLAPDRPAVVVAVTVANRSGADREVALRFSVGGSAGAPPGPWASFTAPVPAAADVTRRVVGGKVVVVGNRDGAAAVHALSPPATELGPTGLGRTVRVPADGAATVTLVVALGTSVPAAAELADTLAATGATELESSARRRWDIELAGLFGGAGGGHPGRLPLLDTADAGVRKVYQLGALGVLMHRRDNPASVLGRTYCTLSPRFWPTLTFLWDFSLSSLLHALLEPAVLRTHLEHWMATDVHTHLGTEWLTGSPVGVWYAVNDYAMVKLARDYLRVTGDLAWLTGPLPTGRAPLEYLVEYATAWRRFATADGLADYGGLGNLLECVSSYTHQVAGLNAAAASSLRFVAGLLARVGRHREAAALHLDASALVERVGGLYLPGRGHFAARHPGGRLVPVRHCYDFSTVATTIGGDLPGWQRREMAGFAGTELRTATWMRALATDDPDAAFSVRPDHQWTGAYNAWPADAVLALYRLGAPREAAQWLSALAASANQGPFGQAHFADGVTAAAAGGARKAPGEQPWLNDWACAASGAYVTAVVEGMFGVAFDVDGTVTASPALDGTDPDARLEGLAVHGRVADVDASGLHWRDR